MKLVMSGARSRSQRLRSNVDDILNTEHSNIQQHWVDTNRCELHSFQALLSQHLGL